MRWIRAALRWFWDNIGNILLGVGMLASIGVPAWAIRAAGLFSDYSPFSWVVAGFAGLLLAAVSVALFSVVYKKVRQGQFFAALSQTPNNFNPKLHNYSDNVFRIQDMMPNPMAHTLEGRTFHNCDFIGPGVVLFAGNIHIHRQTPGPMFFDCGDVIFPPVGTNLTSALVLNNCTLRDCRFYRVGIITSAESVLQTLMTAGFRDPRVPRQQQTSPPATPQPNRSARRAARRNQG